MSRLIISSLLLCGLLGAESGLQAPEVGLLLDRHGAVRSLLGIRANFILGEPLFEGVISAAFTGRSGLVKTSNRLLELDRTGAVISESSAPIGPAVLGFTAAGLPGVVYFPETAELRIRRGRRWLPPNAEIDGQVIAAALETWSRIKLAIRRQQEIWLLTISARTGAVMSQELLPGAKGPVALLRSGLLVYRRDGGLVRRGPEGAESLIETPAPVTSLAVIGRGWVQLGCEGGYPDLALRIGADGETLYYLPGGMK